MNKELKRISMHLLDKKGVDISMFEDSFLNKTMEKRMSVTGSNSLSDYMDFIVHNQNECQSLFDSLYVNYSEFFRNPFTFACLEQLVLPNLLKKKRNSHEKEIRIWSGACAQGQETYSIAILCDELIKSTSTDITCLIFGTDINPTELTAAQKGVFPASSLQKVSLKRLQTYFSQTADSYVVSPVLKQYINFSVFDLLQEKASCPQASIFGHFDLIFCSNLLFYYNAEHRNRILKKVGNCMSDGAFLVTGEIERELLKANQYREVLLNSAIFQKK